MRWRVVIIESEHGWGQRVDEVKYWNEDQEQEARDFVRDFNKDNNKTIVPDWYMYAEEPKLVPDE